MTTALVFPGQGSQAVGMGVALAESFGVAREVFQEVDEALSMPLFKIIKEGPETDLTLTQNAQPAIMAVSMAAFRVLVKETGLDITKVKCVAGHSLGEYSALTAAGALTLADCAQLLQIRGRSMQQAVPQGQGAMAAIIGPEIDAVKEIVKLAQEAAPGEVIEIANHNAQNQIVISGSAKGIDAAMIVAKEKGAKRAVPLTVSAPFHCSLMASAATAMQKALGAVDVQKPVVPVVANVTAKCITSPDEIRDLLVKQVTGMVRWVDSVQTMQQKGVTKILEIGHGNVLAGLIKRIAPEIPVTNIGSPADLETYSKAA